MFQITLTPALSRSTGRGGKAENLHYRALHQTRIPPIPSDSNGRIG
jgi:hypothetical protein